VSPSSVVVVLIRACRPTRTYAGLAMAAVLVAACGNASSSEPAATTIEFDVAEEVVLRDPGTTDDAPSAGNSQVDAGIPLPSVPSAPDTSTPSNQPVESLPASNPGTDQPTPTTPSSGGTAPPVVALPNDDDGPATPVVVSQPDDAAAPSTQTPTSAESPTGSATTTTTAVVTTTTVVAPPDNSVSSPVLSLLNSLVINDEPARVGYDRDLFTHWSDTNGSGCDAREDTLIAQVIADAVPNTSDSCRLDSGRWYSVLDGIEYVGSPSGLDIDHIVALAEAWDSGASAWSSATRQRFANDPRHLVAVTASSNRSKSDSDVGEWRPVRSSWCVVATITVDTKAAYGLDVDPAEYAALVEMLATCGDQDQVGLPSPGQQVPQPVDDGASSTTVSVAPTTSTPVPDDEATNPDCVDINTADSDALDRIVNVGPSRAAQIIDLRPFASVQDLIRVSGIGEVTLGEILDQGLACVR